jgi:hypothetical protein
MIKQNMCPSTLNVPTQPMLQCADVVACFSAVSEQILHFLVPSSIMWCFHSSFASNHKLVDVRTDFHFNESFSIH